MSGSEGVPLVLVGWGAIARRVAALLAARRAPVRIIAVALRDPARAADLPEGARGIGRPEALAALAPRLVVEAAAREAVLPWGLAALAAGADFVPVSTSALAEAGVREALEAAARTAGRQVILPAGALAGIEALAAAAILGLGAVRHEIVKPPAAWQGTAGAGREGAFFEGSAAEAAAAFPKNANAAMVTALAGAGPERTRVALVADRAAPGNGHRITAEGPFGRLAVEVWNSPLAANPKSSELAALSLVRAVEARVRPLVI